MKSTTKKQTIGDVLPAQIRQMIIDEGMKPGDRLPTEQELADRFGVSRMSVREATKSLGYLGIIKSAPKRGLTISNFDLKRVSNILGFHWALCNYPGSQLLQTRMVIEVGSLHFTMKRMTREAGLYDHLLDLALKTEQDIPPDCFIKHEIAYHRGLVESSGIEPLVSFTDILEAFFTKFYQRVIARQYVPEVRNHRRLVELLHQGRLVEAENLLRVHLSPYFEEEA
jgi:GntR family transcriptional regulator, transcriptional repressor for pyruvate dehydrogenase complex